MLEILKQTDKAVMVKDKYGNDTWLPRSQVKISGNHVISATEWIIKEKSIVIENHSEEEQVENTKEVIHEVKFTATVNGEENVTIHTKKRDYERNLYPRKTGVLAGSFLFNFKTNIYKFSKTDENGQALDIVWVGNYENGITFKEFVRQYEESIEAAEEIKEEIKHDGPVVHAEYYTILKCVERDLPVYLVGPAGSGKNHVLQQIAMELGLEFYFTNAVQQEYKVTGFIDAGGHFHETEFYKAFKNGGLFFLDEMDASIPEVLVLLNAAIANRYFEFPNGKIDAHEDFRIVAAGNTMGDGADEQYTGRLVLDQSSLDRFTVIEFNYDKNIELALAKGNVELVNFIEELREECSRTGVRATFSYRAIISVIKLEGAMALEKIMLIAVAKGIDKDTIRAIRPTNLDNRYWRAFKSIA